MNDTLRRLKTLCFHSHREHFTGFGRSGDLKDKVILGTKCYSCGRKVIVEFALASDGYPAYPRLPWLGS